MTAATSRRPDLGKPLLNLLARRVAMGKKQSEFAAALGKSAAHYQKIEQGQGGLRAADALTLCDLTGLTLRNLVATSATLPAAPVALICASCGGDDVGADAAARWDSVNQIWALSGEYDNKFCQDCNADVDLIETPLNLESSDV